MALPLTAKVNARNHLEVGGVDLVDLTREYGTPLFVYDEADIRDRCRRYRRQFKSPDFETKVIYAGKAFISLQLCRLIAEEGLGLDVSSGGELYVAHRAGFPMDRVFVHGNNKTESELRLALELNVGRVVVDSFNELELLDRLARKTNKRPKILLRLTPGIKPSTHSYIQTGQMDSKFGFGLADGIAMSAIDRAMNLETVDLVGLHIHIGSQIFSLHSYTKAIEVVIAFAKEAVDKKGFTASEINLGGGLGIRYGIRDEPSTIERFCRVLISGVAKEVARTGITRPVVMIEPGRSIVGNAGLTLYTIGTIKELPGIRTYVSVDGGMSDNLRPMLYDAVYEGLLANKANNEPTEKVTIAGKHCESGDILIKDALLPKLEVGDILCTPATGAYGYVMANNFNRQPRPAVVMVADGSVRELVRRETYEDLIRLEEQARKIKNKR